MQNVIVSVATNRPTPRATQADLDSLMKAGAMMLRSEGSSDVAFARNIQLSFALHTLRTHAEREVVLCIDDDMRFNVAQAAELCAHAVRNQCPASAVYPTAVSEIAARSDWAPPGKWLAGLGFLAIPAAALSALAKASPEFRWREGETLWEFTQSALHEVDGHARWYGEDYWLCHRLGGVDLLPIDVGHLKTIPLVVDEATLRKIRDGVPLRAAGSPALPFQVKTGQGTGLSVEQETREDVDPELSDYDALGVEKGQ